MMQRWLVLSVVAGVGVAHADKTRSRELFERGKRAYASRQFSAAIENFQRAYGEYPAPEYLQNIAQAFRRLDRCAESIAYFERFLSAKPDADNRVAIEQQLVAERARCAPTPGPPPVAVEPPPEKLDAPGATTTAASLPASASPVRVATREPALAADPTSVREAWSSPPPSRWSATAQLGSSVVSAGPVSLPPLAQVGLGARYRLGLPYDLHAGMLATISPVPYDDMQRGVAWLAGASATVDAHIALGERLGLRGSLGGGVAVFANLGAGNPFTAGARAAAPILLPRVQLAAGPSWRVSNRLSFGASVTVEYTHGRGEVAADIGGLWGLGLSVTAEVGL